MADKSFFIDTSKCTACRGCQVACKQWNQLGAVKTVNRGSHENPPDLSASAYKVVRFNEADVGGKPAWYFFPEQCRHCMEPPCKETADSMVKDSIIKDEATGAVLFTDLSKKLKFKDIQGACPYNVPRQDAKTKMLVKCTMCVDRVKEGLLPACVKTCPTGAMSFGDREAILKKAKAREAEVKKTFPKAQLLDADDLRAIYLVVDDRNKYWKFAGGNGEKGISRHLALRRLFRPARDLAKEASLLGFLGDSKRAV